MKTAVRILTVLAVVVAAALSGAASAAASEPPTLGGTLAVPPYGVTHDEPGQDLVTLANLSTIPVRVQIEVEGAPGWTVEDETAWMEVGERRTIRVVSIGEEPGVIRATLTPLGIEGTDINALSLSRELRPYEPPITAILWPFILTFAASVVAVLTLLYLWRRWEPLRWL